MAELRIRAYQEPDRAAVVDLWQRCGLVVPQNDPNRDIDRKVDEDSDSFLVGLTDNLIVATCMVGYEGHRGWINYLAVDPQEQRQGFGSQLMAAAEERLGSIGCPKVNLQVRGGNLDVIAFYKSLGFATDDVVSLGKRLHFDHPASG